MSASASRPTTTAARPRPARLPARSESRPPFDPAPVGRIGLVHWLSTADCMEFPSILRRLLVAILAWLGCGVLTAGAAAPQPAESPKFAPDQIEYFEKH